MKSLTLQQKVTEHIATMEYALGLLDVIKLRSKLSTKKQKVLAQLVINGSLVFLNTQSNDLAKCNITNSSEWGRLENYIDTYWNKYFKSDLEVKGFSKEAYLVQIPHWYEIRKDISRTSSGIIDSRYSKNSHEWKTFVEDTNNLIEILF